MIVKYKTPTDVLDYSISWADELNNEPITSSKWTTALTIPSSQLVGMVTTAYLGGGVLDKLYNVTITVVTATRTISRYFQVKIVDKVPVDLK